MLTQGRFADLSLATYGVMTPIVGSGLRLAMPWMVPRSFARDLGRVFGRPIAGHLGSVDPHCRFEPKVGDALDGAKVFCPGSRPGLWPTYC